MYKKTLVLSVLCLFIGASDVPNLKGDIEQIASQEHVKSNVGRIKSIIEPVDHKKIQDTVDMASESDTIVAYNKAFYEVVNKHLNLPGFNDESTPNGDDIDKSTLDGDGSKVSMISLSIYQFDTKFGEVKLPKNLTIDKILPGEEEYYLVQFMGPIKKEWKDQLQQLDVAIYDYIPYYTFIVKMNSITKLKIENLSFVRWIGIYQPAYKISPALWNMNGLVNLTILFFNGEDLDAIATSIEEDGGIILYSGETSLNGIIKAQINATRIVEIANIAGISWIELWTAGSADNYQASWVIQSNVQDSRPVFDHNLSGQNQIVTVCDSGLDTDDGKSRFIHETFDDPSKRFYFGLINLRHRKVFYYFYPKENGIDLGDYDDDHRHGTHVAGIIAGDAPAYNVYDVDKYDGMQFGGKLIISDIHKMGWHVPSNYDNIYRPAYDHGSRIHSNSWGTRHTVEYTNAARMSDNFMWNYKDFLILRSMGNTGPDPYLLRPEAVAKNVISCGASENIFLDDPSYDPNNLAYFSSRGPCADDRIKPTILAPGRSLISAKMGTTDEYYALAGTSMSTPAIAGASALIRQYFMEGWYPSGARTFKDSFTPSAALIKAMLINGAVEITGEGAYDNFWNFYPNCNQGWGRIHLDNSLYFQGDLKKLSVVDNSSGLNTEEQIEYKIEVSDVAEPLEITLVWTDYPAIPNAIPSIVNDLDLQVIDPSGNIYLGNVFSGKNPGQSITGGTCDDRNVEECVLILPPNVIVGNWTVRIIGTNVPYGPQPFALVVTGGGAIKSKSTITIKHQPPKLLEIMNSNIKICKFFDYLKLFRLLKIA